MTLAPHSNALTFECICGHDNVSAMLRLILLAHMFLLHVVAAILTYRI
jgi:hypothetical protein